MFAKAVWFGTHLSYRPPDSDISLLDWFNACFISFKRDDHYITTFTAVVLQVLWRCRNLRVMEGKHVDPITAIHMIYTSWNSYRLSFSNHDAGTKPASQPFNHKKWSTVDSLPSSGVSIVTAVRRFIYTLRQQEDLQLMNLMIIRKGIQLAIDISPMRNCCNIVVLQKNTAALVDYGYKSN
ncbi:uncharacterized protein G2W53_016365 [Senna tora]|uniref:Uncharacterized protein n=1 Tax=Senna tora TaxID=362788 RepID=A0A834WMX9_9FABA|nr:uncharacterized protein G2W53_016365 [Senna tora]